MRAKIKRRCSIKLYTTYTFHLLFHFKREFRHVAILLEKEIKKNSLAQFTLLAIHRERSESPSVADKREPQANAETRIRERIAMHETISAATNTSSRHSFAMLDEPPIHARFRLYSRFSSRYSYYYFHSRQPL